MVGSSAVGVLSTDIGQAADVHTFVADTRPLASTVGVADALEGNTADLGVAVCSGWTRAHRAMISGGANCIRSTGPGDLTGVLTFSIIASCCFWAVIIRQTLVR